MKTCKNCGRVYDDNLSFCPNCHSRQVASFVGAKSATDQEYEKIQQELNVKKEAAKKTSTNLFVFFVILFVAIALGVFFYMNTPQHKLDSEASLLQESRPSDFGRMADSSSYPTGVL